jgi:hypothetical protein
VTVIGGEGKGKCEAQQELIPDRSPMEARRNVVVRNDSGPDSVEPPETGQVRRRGEVTEVQPGAASENKKTSVRNARAEFQLGNELRHNGDVPQYNFYENQPETVTGARNSECHHRSTVAVHKGEARKSTLGEKREIRGERKEGRLEGRVALERKCGKGGRLEGRVALKAKGGDEGGGESRLEGRVALKAKGEEEGGGESRLEGRVALERRVRRGRKGQGQLEGRVGQYKECEGGRKERRREEGRAVRQKPQTNQHVNHSTSKAKTAPLQLTQQVKKRAEDGRPAPPPRESDNLV